MATALAREQVKDVTEQTTLWQGNQQTRDEAQHLLRFTWAGRWAGMFRTTLGLAGEYRQMVFIRAGLSAESYVDRLLHWEPGFVWAPGKFSLRSAYHFWVSYQVRDRESE